MCLTPHLRKGMFETEDETILRQYRRLVAKAREQGIPVRIFMSREYHWDSGLRIRLKSGAGFSMGKNCWILLEFSSLHSFGDLEMGIAEVRRSGYRPLIAHVERYPALEENPDMARKLISAGAALQVNAGSLLGEEGRRQKKFARMLMEQNLISVVASDAHGTEYRRPNLDQCKDLLLKKMGQRYTRKVLVTNPVAILSK